MNGKTVFGWVATFYDSDDELKMKVTHSIRFASTEESIIEATKEYQKKGDKYVLVSKIWYSANLE
jgi:hypothetical protein